MHLINRSCIDEKTIRNLAQLSGVADRNFVLFLDDKLNTFRADAARKNLEEHPNWQHLRTGEAMGDTDHPPRTVTKATIATEKLPAHVIAAIGCCSLLVYLDATWTAGGEMDLVLTLAHELRHVWQYFNAPIVYHSQIALSFFVPPQLTPCELDAEKAGKRVLGEIYGDLAVRDYLDAELARCKPEYRETTERLIALDPAADPHMEAKTIELVEHHASEIVRQQIEGRSLIPEYVMPGVRELGEALKGTSKVRLLP
jgi:hypothetical protein